MMTCVKFENTGNCQTDSEGRGIKGWFVCYMFQTALRDGAVFIQHINERIIMVCVLPEGKGLMHMTTTKMDG